ncbi:MAG: Gfo/Idh/MocA family oxidoreductase [Blastocatellia bacterium]|nr:Gfo/Idh/MocA family oxidoreductase [Blastocatellia bacterium]MDW8169273.1 Gfo/Idh/MocA family oxidoreductase [Acidobacteriota bacterium]
MGSERVTKVLIVGCGSIGERHLRLFREIEDVEVVPCEPRVERLRTILSRYSCREYYERLEDVNVQAFDGMVIGTPPHTHVPIALMGARAGVHLFIEKPLSHSLDGVDELIALVREKNLVATVGYCLRFHPGIERVREWLRDGKIGQVRAARVKAGQHFPSARPDYRQIYFAKRDMGGGILLDGSHEIDLALWFFGRPVEVAGFYDTLSEMEIETDDIAVLLMRFENRALVEVHLNAFQWDYSRNIEIIGSEGTIVWDYSGPVGFYKAGQWHWEEVIVERDDLYRKQARHFLDAICKKTTVRVSLEEARDTLLVCFAARRAADTRSVVSIESVIAGAENPYFGRGTSPRRWR